MTVATISGFFVLTAVTQRLVVVPLVWVAPAFKDRLLAVWIRWLAGTLIGVVRFVGGGKFEPLPSIPSAAGVLVLMNHQSLLDIPIVVRSFESGYPRIVTRKRYAIGKPLLSRMIKLYQHPVVDPSSGMKTQLKLLRSVARDPRVPIVVFPEGTRSRDGELLPFRRGAVDTFLRHRRWQVYLLTSDGTLPCGRLEDILNGVDLVDCRVRVAGPFDTPSDPKDFPAWLQEMEDRMRKSLAELRMGSGTRSESESGSKPEPGSEAGRGSEPERESEPGGTMRPA